MIEIIHIDSEEENKIKYFNINVSEGEIERKPDVVTLYGGNSEKMLEYVSMSIIENVKSEIQEAVREKADDVCWSTALYYSLKIIDKYTADIKRG